MYMLPEELQHKVLFHLPTAEAVRCKTICKQWQKEIEAWTLRAPTRDYVLQFQKPFYLLYPSKFNVPNCLSAYLYISDKKRWVHFQTLNSDQEIETETQVRVRLPHLRLPPDSNFISASGGLVCFFIGWNFFVWNPILRGQIRLLPVLPGFNSDKFFAMAFVTDVRSRKYALALVTSHYPEISNPNIDEFTLPNYIDIMLYKSETKSWVKLHSEILVGWMGPFTCVICNNVLYGVLQNSTRSHKIMAYDLLSQERGAKSTMMSLPYEQTIVSLLNLNGKLILVGSTKNGTSSNNNTICIWEMCAKEWKEITRIPPDVMLIFLQKDCYYYCSGCGDFVFILLSYLVLLTYEFTKDVWTITHELPLHFPYDLGQQGGFCFEPRLDIAP